MKPQSAPATSDIVFLVDVDNTLLDNDHVIADIGAHLVTQFDRDNADRYWRIFEQLRTELGYADYLGALQRYRLDEANDPDETANSPQLLELSAFLIDYPFPDRLYPGAIDALKYVERFGPTVILSDGDVVFQPRKVQRSGLWQAVDGRVLIFIHKELMIPVVERRYPAAHYVMVDDKLRILAAMKKVLGPRLTTVFVRQGHYAVDPVAIATYPPADITIERIGDLRHVDIEAMREMKESE